MLGLGQHWYDLLPILLIALLFFGAKRLPEMGSAVGKTIREFQKSMREVGGPSDSATAPAAVAGSAEAQQISSPAAGPSVTAKAEPANPAAEAVSREPIER